MALLVFSLEYYSDGAQAYEPELVNKAVDNSGIFLRIKVITYDNIEEVNEAYKDYLVENGLVEDRESVSTVNGWARFSTDGPRFCVIHVVEPFTTYDQVFRTWGHELGHCVYGAFHE